MDTTHRHSCGLGDPGDVEDPITTPRWWIIVWSAWGMIVGALILWLDRDPIAAALWLLVGIAFGTCVLRILGPFSTPLFEWFDKFASDPESKNRMIELAIEERTETEEFKRLVERDSFGPMLIVPPMCGLFHGALLGGIGGALCELDPTLDITASQGAFYGVLLGIVGISFLTAVGFAVMIPVDKSQPLISRMARRTLMVVSPIFVFPVVWYCVKWAVKRRPPNAAS